MTFIIDHISKPRMNSNKFDLEWSNDLKEVSKYKNVFCKLYDIENQKNQIFHLIFHLIRSGLVTEAAEDWSIQHIEPYVLVCSILLVLNKIYSI